MRRQVLAPEEDADLVKGAHDGGLAEAAGKSSKNAEGLWTESKSRDGWRAMVMTEWTDDREDVDSVRHYGYDRVQVLCSTV